MLSLNIVNFVKLTDAFWLKWYDSLPKTRKFACFKERSN